MHFEHGQNVLFHGQPAKDRSFLRQIADAEARATIHRHPRHFIAVDRDHAFIHRHEAGDHVETGGLAGAVRPEQANGLATPHNQRHAVDDAARVIGLRQPMGHERAFIARLVANGERL